MKIKHVDNTMTLFLVAPAGRVRPRGPQVWRWVGTKQLNGFFDLETYGRYENGVLVAAASPSLVSHNPEQNISVVKDLG